ncbi:dirigent protein 23-like [Corylus avellana]|uniref:dirigent protein 23-like n=1 Tax=Corylus avellana TaxID=13451 RepID=UPI00286B61EF|nr:dirigent protein 23-like [Corylus avellana]
MSKKEYMDKLIGVVLMLIFSLVAWAQSVEEESCWATRSVVQKKETEITNLHFYFHDTVSGKNPSAVRVAQAAGTNKSPTLFGVVMIADDPLTEKPDPDSKLVGRAQGLYGSAGQQELALIMALNFGFVDGIYNGSSISLLGKNPALQPVREIAIVGGTGVFRLARGYAIAHTYWFNATTGDAIVQYNVTVVH